MNVKETADHVQSPSMHFSHLLSLVWLGGGICVCIACFINPESSSFLGSVSCRLRAFGHRVAKAAEYAIGRNVSSWLIWVADWIWNKPNPLGPIFYLTIVHGGYLLWRQIALDYVPLSSIHRITTAVSMGVCLVSFLIVYWSDPGRISPSNQDALVSQYEYDGLLFVRDNPCGTCGLSAKPARSKHCRVCNRCVPKMDHHCLFLNNDISGKNHRWFIAFLLSHVWFCVYASYMIMWNLLVISEREQLFKSQYWDPVQKRVVPASYGMVARWLASNHTLLWIMFVLSTVMTFVISAFAVFHLFLVSTNQTSNERHKRGILKQGLEDYLRDRSVQSPVADTAGSPAVGGKSPIRRRHRKRPKSASDQSEVKLEVQKPGLTLDDLAQNPDILNNIYDRGMASNIVEIIFPS